MMPLRNSWVTIFNLQPRIKIKCKKKTKKAIRIEEKNFHGIPIHFLMIVIVAYMLSNAMVDLILRKLSLSQNTEMKSASTTQKTTLVFCLLMYFAGGITPFRKRFEVKDVRLKNFFKSNFNFRSRIFVL